MTASSSASLNEGSLRVLARALESCRHKRVEILKRQPTGHACPDRVSGCRLLQGGVDGTWTTLVRATLTQAVKMHPIKLFLISLVFVLLATNSKARSAEIRLNAEQVLAVADALSRFRSDGHHLEAYSVFITSENDTIDVALVPDPISTGSMGAEASEAPEIHYFYDATGRKYRKQLLGK